MIKISDFPELKLISWWINTPEIEESLAFEIYERNWRYVAQGKLLPHESALIERLTKAYGHGVMNV